VAHENCRDLLGGLSEFVDGEASEQLCAEIRRHMTDCRKCRIVIDTLTKTVALYHQLPQPAVPTTALERLYTTLHVSDYARRNTSRQRTQRTPR
jgi:hypothetical protein